MANTNYNPNARYDTGPNSAGTGRVSFPLRTGVFGLAADGTVTGSELRSAHQAGHTRNNSGPNVAGAPRSISGK
jgi:hypothetical protein